MRAPALRDSFRFLLPILLLAPGMAQAQTATQQPPADVQQRERIEKQLKELRDQQQALLNSMQKQVADFNARIAAMEAELGVTPSKDQPAQADSGAESSAPLPASAQDTPAQANPDAHGSTLALATPANSVMDVRGVSYLSQKQQGPFPYVPGKGFVLASGPNGEVDFFVKGYVRYLNQLGLDRFYTDAFGRTFELDLRQDIQLNRLQWGLHGWLFDPRFRYFWYAWTQNVSQGDPAQVVIGGNIAYKFDDALTATAGIFSLPSTRSTAQSFPNWLRIDHRSMADEYFRGSYIQGYMASGELTDTLDYKVALAGNLSALGVSASQLDNCLCTVTSMLYWMPTTGEYGPGNGFGDYEYHEKLATLLGVHFTYSREDAQEQPGVNAFENSQIRLSDGTLLFAPNAFNTGGMVQKATFQMLDLDAGVKWRGWSLDAEYYFRWLDDFKVTGMHTCNQPVRSWVPGVRVNHAQTGLLASLFLRIEDFRSIWRPMGPCSRIDALSLWPQGGAHERSGSLHGPFGSRLHGSSVCGGRHRVGLHVRRWHLVLRQQRRRNFDRRSMVCTASLSVMSNGSCASCGRYLRLDRRSAVTLAVSVRISSD